MVIDVTASEIVIALLENKQLVELNKEKSNLQFSVGDIYLGKVKKIMPGLNAAFVDVGYEKDAFLHYLDLGPQIQSLLKYIRKGQTNNGAAFSIGDFELETDIQKTGKITHKGLDYYVAERVKQLTDGKQSPVSIAPQGITDFPIAVVGR